MKMASCLLSTKLLSIYLLLVLVPTAIISKADTLNSAPFTNIERNLQTSKTAVDNSPPSPFHTTSLKDLLTSPPEPRRWHSSAYEATEYLGDMDVPDVAEVLKLTRTGNPLYDGITTVMTVADYGIRKRQELQPKENNNDSGFSSNNNKDAEDASFAEKSRSSNLGRSASYNDNSSNSSIGGGGGFGEKLFKAREESEKKISNKLNEQKIGKENRPKKNAKYSGNKDLRQVRRKVIVDEAFLQYFADRQWFMQQILSPVFQEEISRTMNQLSQ